MDNLNEIFYEFMKNLLEDFYYLGLTLSKASPTDILDGVYDESFEHLYATLEKIGEYWKQRKIYCKHPFMPALCGVLDEISNTKLTDIKKDDFVKMGIKLSNALKQIYGKAKYV